MNKPHLSSRFKLRNFAPYEGARFAGNLCIGAVYEIKDFDSTAIAVSHTAMLPKSLIWYATSMSKPPMNQVPTYGMQVN